MPRRGGNWVIALWLYLAVSLITIFFHMPLNVRLAAAIGSPVGDALDFYKSIALVGPVTDENAVHDPRDLATGPYPPRPAHLAIPVYALRALAARTAPHGEPLGGLRP
jgi:hypothetical protein